MKSESEQCDIEDKKNTISETIMTNISVTNANIFFIADKKSKFFFYISIGFHFHKLYTCIT